MYNKAIGTCANSRGSRHLVLATVMLTAASAGSAQTSLKTDASWGRTAQTLTPSASAISFTSNAGKTVNVPGNAYVVAQTLGRKAGPNLFHSFGTFNVGSQDAALFTTVDLFENVVTRVSGGAY